MGPQNSGESRFFFFFHILWDAILACDMLDIIMICNLQLGVSKGKLVYLTIMMLCVISLETVYELFNIFCGCSFLLFGFPGSFSVGYFIHIQNKEIISVSQAHKNDLEDTFRFNQTRLL